jgi:TPR repeat protein
MMRRLFLALSISLLVAFPALAADDISALAEASLDGDKGALTSLQAKAADGNAEAQHWLGVLYSMPGGISRDPAEAFMWFQKSAEQGNLEAQFQVALTYMRGKGVKKDDTEALKWLRKAADQGHEQAQLHIAAMYRSGDRVPKDDREAMKWLRKSANQGNRGTQQLISEMYATGRGVTQDWGEAYFWRMLAERLLAKDWHDPEIDKIRLHLTEEQIAEVEKRLREWTPAPGTLSRSLRGCPKCVLDHPAAQPLPK